MSRDPEQEYFADGITDDIITALSRLRWLFLIARNSSFTYKGRAVDVRQVARELGVRYVLEGSVRAAGERIRITGQLSDAETGRHIWTEKYDRRTARYLRRSRRDRAECRRLDRAASLRRRGVSRGKPAAGAASTCGVSSSARSS